MNIRVFFVLAILILIQSGEAVQHLKSITVSPNITYDCIDIYKQPSLDHPSLKHHRVQLKPSTSRSESRIRVSEEGNIGCPKGTVPILRVSEEDVIKAKAMAEQHFKPLDTPTVVQRIAAMRTHDDGAYRGVSVGMSVAVIPVGTDESSYGQAFVGAQINNEQNFIQAGWMVNPGLVNDGHPWSYGLWKGNYGNGCFGTMCPGFVQVSNQVAINAALVYDGPYGYFQIKINQDPSTGNWWLIQIHPDSFEVQIGYWPKELFSLLGNGAPTVGFGGVVTVSPNGHGPPMGNGSFARDDPEQCGFMSKLMIVDSNNVVQNADKFKLDTLKDSECYTLDYKGDILFYGGPGGEGC